MPGMPEPARARVRGELNFGRRSWSRCRSRRVRGELNLALVGARLIASKYADPAFGQRA